MLHLSEILGLPVIDAAGARVGTVRDLQVDAAQERVERVLVRRGREMLAVPWPAVESLSPEARKVELVDGGAPLPADGVETATLLARDVLDSQIIDIQGRKVVRVNDLRLEWVHRDLVLRAVEVGMAGAVRRLAAGLLAPRIVRQLAGGFSERIIPWDYVGLVEPRAPGIRLKVHQHLARMHPADLADILEDLGRVERGAVVSSLDAETAAQALSEAEPNVQASVVEAMLVDQAADLLEEMPPDEAADLLGDLPEARSRELLAAMEADEAEDVRELLGFHEDTAGGLMTTEFFRADASWSVERTLRALREVDEDLVEEVEEIPVVDAEDRLVGVAPLVRLVRAEPGAPVTAAMRREARAVLPSATFKEVVERFDKYNLRGLAVVDEHEVLQGMINIDDLFGRLAAES